MSFLTAAEVHNLVAAQEAELISLRGQLEEQQSRWSERALWAEREWGTLREQVETLKQNEKNWRSLKQAVTDAWSLGTWCGPCAHDRDPYTRCEECEGLTPFQALEVATRAKEREAILKPISRIIAETEALIDAGNGGGAMPGYVREEVRVRWLERRAILKEVAEEILARGK